MRKNRCVTKGQNRQRSDFFIKTKWPENDEEEDFNTTQIGEKGYRGRVEIFDDLFDSNQKAYLSYFKKEPYKVLHLCFLSQVCFELPKETKKISGMIISFTQMLKNEGTFWTDTVEIDLS